MCRVLRVPLDASPAAAKKLTRIRMSSAHRRVLHFFPSVHFHNAAPPRRLRPLRSGDPHPPWALRARHPDLGAAGSRQSPQALGTRLRFVNLHPFFFRVAVNSPSSPPKSIAVIPVTTHKTSKQGEGVFCKTYRGYSAEIWIAAINIDRKEGLFRKICYHRSTRWVGSPAVGTAPLSSPAAARHGLLPRGSSLSCSQVSAAIS